MATMAVTAAADVALVVYSTPFVAAVALTQEVEVGAETLSLFRFADLS